jgi:5-enolpyruvylshikimate-3-phosphate synthase
MEKSLNEAESGRIINSEDHRVVQAIAMRYFFNELWRGDFVNPDCVNKTWPRFWDFLADAENIVTTISP